mmetsp:Transcript_14874/g.39940  ORF Transcript_14874/g.39940 Transcript_14874/m.39940 type:complete len:295 (+) Transcript_14874:3-887(+)
MIAPSLRDKDCIEYKPNPKIKDTVSWGLYEQYKRAKTVAEARRLGARNIDFAFDSNWGYLQVQELCIEPLSQECRLADADMGLPTSLHQQKSAISRGFGKDANIRVRVKEMSEGHKGIAISRKVLARLAGRAPRFREVSEETWAAVDGPVASVPLEVLRILLYWAHHGVLLYPRKLTKALHSALKAAGVPEAAKAVKLLEAKMIRAAASRAAERQKQGAEAKKRKATVGSARKIGGKQLARVARAVAAKATPSARKLRRAGGTGGAPAKKSKKAPPRKRLTKVLKNGLKRRLPR